MDRFGVIFDWDGVVVDSSRLHVLSWERLARREGRDVPDTRQLGSLGMKTQEVISDLLGWTHDADEAYRLTLDKEDMFRCLARETGIDSTPGVLDFLRSLKNLSIPLAVGSSAPRLNIEAAMDVLNARDIFDVVVSGDDVQNGKPAPDIFLKAAESIDCRPEDCVVFEDAPAGIAAARAAGMRTVGVLTAYPKDELAEADRLIGDFTSMSAIEFAAWLTMDANTVVAAH